MEMARNLYAGARRRWYHFLGPIFIALLVGAFTVSDVLSDREEQQRIREKVTALQEGYIIYYRLPQGGWTSMFVDEIRGDSVVVRENRLSVDKQNDVRRIDDQENYSHKQTLYPRSDLVRLADEKRIGKIYRNYTYEMEYLRSLENE